MERESLPPPALADKPPVAQAAIVDEPVQVPPPVPERGEALATPGDLPADADGKLPFWRPSWGEVAVGLRWRWLFVGPAILVMLGVMGLCVGQLAFFQIYWLPWE